MKYRTVGNRCPTRLVFFFPYNFLLDWERVQLVRSQSGKMMIPFPLCSAPDLRPDWVCVGVLSADRKCRPATSPIPVPLGMKPPVFVFWSGDDDDDDDDDDVGEIQHLRHRHSGDETGRSKQ